MVTLKNFFIFITCVIGIFIAYETIRVVFLLRRSEVLIKNSRPYEQQPLNATSTIIFIGDSTAVGTGSNDAHQSVAGRFGNEQPHARIINKGINGQKIHELQVNFNAADFKKAELLIIQIGGNDILRLSKPEHVEADLDALLTKAKSVSDHILILHSGDVGQAPFFPPFTGFIWTNQTKKIRDIYIKQGAMHSVTYVDLYSAGVDTLFNQNKAKYYANDFVHPSGDGYGIWFNEIKKVL